MNKILERVGVDKVLHFLAGFGIACCLTLLMVDRWGGTALQGSVVGLFAATLVGVVKELLDDEIDWRDLAATVAGAAVVLIGELVINN